METYSIKTSDHYTKKCLGERNYPEMTSVKRNFGYIERFKKAYTSNNL